MPAGVLEFRRHLQLNKLLSYRILAAYQLTWCPPIETSSYEQRASVANAAQRMVEQRRLYTPARQSSLGCGDYSHVLGYVEAMAP